MEAVNRGRNIASVKFQNKINSDMTTLFCKIVQSMLVYYTAELLGLTSSSVNGLDGLYGPTFALSASGARLA